MFEAVCKSYYKRGNPKPKHKSPIEAGDMEKLKSYLISRLTVRTGFKNLFGLICAIIWAGEEGRAGANLQRARSNSRKTTKIMNMSP